MQSTSLDALEPFDDYALPYSEDYLESDIIRFVKYEIYFNPDGCLTQILTRAYNDAYASAANQVPNEFECCEGTTLDYSTAFNFLLDFFEAQGRTEGLRSARAFWRDFWRTLRNRF